MTERNSAGRNDRVDSARAVPVVSTPVRREILSSVDLSMFDGNPNIVASRANVRRVSTK